jgi:hypothetical protein
MARSPLPLPPETDLLLGLNAIANAFGRSPKTIRRWIKTEDLPARRLPDQTWVTSMGSIRQWISAYEE